MFYRIEKSLDINDRIDYEVLRNRIPGQERRRDLPPRLYQFQFEELPTSMYPDVRLFKAPVLPAWNMSTGLQVTIKSGDLPEFYVLYGHIYISQRVKDVIDKVDAMPHQYWPVSVLDENGNPAVKQQFYYMNVRRYVKVASKGESSLPTDFDMDVQEVNYLPRVQHDARVRSLVESYPLWRALVKSFNDRVLYISADLFQALKDAGITGLDEYSVNSGKGEESVAHV